jgi:hypothetical protein
MVCNEGQVSFKSVVLLRFFSVIIYFSFKLEYTFPLLLLLNMALVSANYSSHLVLYSGTGFGGTYFIRPRGSHNSWVLSTLSHYYFRSTYTKQLLSLRFRSRWPRPPWNMTDRISFCFYALFFGSYLACGRANETDEKKYLLMFVYGIFHFHWSQSCG